MKRSRDFGLISSSYITCCSYIFMIYRPLRQRQAPPHSTPALYKSKTRNERWNPEKLKKNLQQTAAEKPTVTTPVRQPQDVQLTVYVLDGSSTGISRSWNFSTTRTMQSVHVWKELKASWKPPMRDWRLLRKMWTSYSPPKKLPWRRAIRSYRGNMANMATRQRPWWATVWNHHQRPDEACLPGSMCKFSAKKMSANKT